MQSEQAEIGQTYHRRILEQIRALFQIEDLRGVDLFSTLNRVAQMLELYDARIGGEDLAVTAPRWRVLLFLFLSGEIGKTNGLTPTELSRFQQVSKNTVSSLLRGLEEQGYIVRELDPEDLRLFRIHLSQSGRELVLRTAPGRIRGMNQLLLDSLDADEIAQLDHLLKKLQSAVHQKYCRGESRGAGSSEQGAGSSEQ